MLGDLIVGAIGEIVMGLLRRRRERRSHKRERVLGLMRLQSGETSGVSARWHQFTTHVTSGHLGSSKVDIAVLGVQRRTKPATRGEKAMAMSFNMEAALLEIQTPTSVIEWAISTHDVHWATQRLGFSITL